MSKSLKFIIISLMLIACSKSENTEYNKKISNLKRTAESINKDFKAIREEVGLLAKKIEDLYINQSTILSKVDKSKYEIAKNGVMYKPKDDGGSAVFVSGVIPVNEDIKRIVYFTEPIENELKKLSEKYPEISQSYYNDKHSYNRIYPYFDVLSQYEAGMDIPSFNFYFMADEKHNPEKYSLWVNEPYVDPAGRGWMVSAIAPVYYKGELVGVLGIDVTINQITKRYILENPANMMMIIDKNGFIVAAQDATINLLSFPPLFDHKYIETIKQDTYRKENYNLLLSRDTEVRKLANQIIKNKQKLVKSEINGEKITIISEYVDELNWFIIELMR